MPTNMQQANPYSGGGFQDIGVPPVSANETGVLSSQHTQDALRDYVTYRAQVSGNAFTPVLARFKNAAYAMQCSYTPVEQAKYAAQGVDIYLGLINAKTRAATAWVLDILSNHMEQPWGLKPSPVSDIPDEMQQLVQERLMAEAQMLGIDPSLLSDAQEQLERLARRHAQDLAKESAEKLEDFIKDTLLESGWIKEFEQFAHDFTLYPYAALIAPVAEIKRKLKRPVGGEVAVLDDITLAAKRLAPYGVIPAPDATDIHTCEYVFVHDLMQPDELIAAKGLDGFDASAIDAILAQGVPAYSVGNGMNEEPAYIRMIRQIESAGESTMSNGAFRRMRYFGRIPNKMLIERDISGMRSRYTRAKLNGGELSLVEGVSECEIWIVNGIMIRAAVVTDFINHRPIHIASYITVAGSVIGRGLADELMPHQRMVNATVRAQVKNMAYAAGAIGTIDVGQLADGEPEPTTIEPYRLIRIDPDIIAGGSSQALKFFNVPSQAAELMDIIRQYMNLADEHSGIPAYALGTGQDVGAVGRTASGLSMLMSNAGKSVKLSFKSLDRAMTDMVRMFADWVILYHPDESMKVDVSVLGYGASILLQRELMASRTYELLQLLQPYAQAGIITPDTITMLLRKVVENQGFDADTLLIPDPKRQMQMQMMTQQQQAQPQAQPQLGQQPARAGGAPPSPSMQVSQGTPAGDNRFVQNPQGAQPMPVAGLSN